MRGEKEKSMEEKKCALVAKVFFCGTRIRLIWMVVFLRVWTEKEKVTRIGRISNLAYSRKMNREEKKKTKLSVSRLLKESQWRHRRQSALETVIGLEKQMRIQSNTKD